MTLFTDWTLTDPHYFWGRGILWGILAATLFWKHLIPWLQQKLRSRSDQHMHSLFQEGCSPKEAPGISFPNPPVGGTGETGQDKKSVQPGQPVIIMWPFKHRHKWIREERVNFNLDGLVTFFLRRCKCGAVEIQHAGPGGDKQWHPFDGSFKTEWEREWFEKTEILAKERRRRGDKNVDTDQDRSGMVHP